MDVARKLFQVPGQFAMYRGGSLERPVIAYETWGRLNARRDNAILIFTGMSPSAHAASSPEDPSPGWWEPMVGPSRPIDTRRHFVICMNSLGSCFGSTGPASIDQATGKPYGLSFPALSLEDVAEAGRLLVDHLGIGRLHALIGPSMGGMTALAFAIRNPGRARNLVLLSTAARALPSAIALRSLQREIIRSDPAWHDGNYTSNPVTGMRLARKLGMITYRSAREWEQRFGRDRTASARPGGDTFGPDFEVESYLENHANKFIDRFDANCYLYLSRASDLFDVAEHGAGQEASVAAALARVRVERVLVVGVASDTLFPIAQQRELAAGLAAGGSDVKLVELPSIQGHDSFLVDFDRFRPVVASFLAERSADHGLDFPLGNARTDLVAGLYL
ncbi:MAG: homoserine O-acetyltransferase [Gammaproteobacteria bacterium PRO9]|nr:homoserine O-acetyltransferase [Gammaproteobacteria bacterium PRO9]